MLLTSVPAFSAGSGTEPITLKNLNSAISVTGASFKNSPEAVFNIQDLHFNTEAQKKISALLEQINKAYPDFELYVEGASQKSGFDRIFYNLGRKNAEAFIDALFESGNMSGAEYFAAKNGKTINPLEDQQIYESNLLLFADLIENKNKISALVYPLESKFSSLRNKYFSKKQHKIFSAYKTYLSNAEAKRQYYSYLKDEAVKSGFNINEYPNIALYMLVSDMSASSNQKKLSAQFQRLFSDLKGLLNYKQYSQIVSLSNGEGDRYALMSYLYEHREKIGLGKYPELKKFVVSLVLSEKINEIEFLSEENNLLLSLASYAAETPEVKDILFLSSFLEIYKKVLGASASPHEYDYYKSNLDEFKETAARYAGKDSLSALGGYEIKARDFNEANLKRNEIFLNNVFGSLPDAKTAYLSEVFGVSANAGKILERYPAPRVKAIVAGGFHTSGINEILNEKQISSITFTPKLLSKPADYSQRYVEYAKSLSQIQSNAIPLPDAKGLLPSVLAGRVLDCVPDMQKKGLPNEAIIAGIKEFMSINEKISDIDADYDEKTGVFSISFTENGNRRTIAERIDAENASEEVTYFSKNIPALARSIFSDIVRVFSNDILRSGLRAMLASLSYGEKEIETIFGEGPGKIEQSFWDNLDFGAFFDHNRGLFGKIITSIFEMSASEEYPSIQNRIKNEIIMLFPEDTRNMEVEVIISDSSMLISEGAYCAALMERDGQTNTLKFYIHDEFIKALGDLEATDRRIKIQSLIYHEFFENQALYDGKSAIYGCFGNYLEYLKAKGENSDRTTENFHKYLVFDPDKAGRSDRGKALDDFRSFSFGNFTKRNYGTNMLGRQQALNVVVTDFTNAVTGKHEKIEYLYKLDSLDNVDDALKDDMMFLRMGDKDTVEKYARMLKDRLPEIIGEDEPGNYVIAFRNTFPMHIMQQVAERAVEMLSEEGIDIKTVYVSQKEYMNYSPILGIPAVQEDELSRGMFSVDGSQKEKITGKNVIFIEDTCKTEYLFSRVSAVLNDAEAGKIIPLALFDMRSAKTRFGAVDEAFNVNRLLTDYIKLDPKAAAKKIIEIQNQTGQGQASKYLYYALFDLMRDNKDNGKKFNDIIGVLNGDGKNIDSQKTEEAEEARDARLAKHKLLQDMAEIQRLYPKIAHSVTPLIYALLVEKTAVFKSEMLNAFNAARALNLFDEKQAGKDLIISKEDADLWVKRNIALLPLYAKIAGYSKIIIKLPKGVSGNKKSSELMFWQDLAYSAQTFNVSCVLQYESEENLDLQVIDRYKSEMDKILDGSNLKLKVEGAKKEFRDMIKRGSYGDASEKYKESIKKIMRDTDSLVRKALKEKFNIGINRLSYSIVLGGSESKGSATPDSDIYFDIIADSKETAEFLEDFSFLYRYALDRSGIKAYMSGSDNVSYVGEQITSLSLAAGSDMSDERAVAKFFDFEPISEIGDKQSSVYKKYLKDVSKSLKNSGIIDILQREIMHISRPYYEILLNGSYGSTDNRPPFFGNLYAAAYSSGVNENGKRRQHDYRWVLRSFEIGLKDILIRNADKIDLLEVPKNTGALIRYVFDKGLVSIDLGNDTEEFVNGLVNAWETIAFARMKKDADGMHYEWTDMGDEEVKAINFFKNIVNEEVIPRARKVEESLRKKLISNDAMNFIIREAKTRYSKKEEEKAKDRINYYMEWAGKEATDEMMMALYLCDLSKDVIESILDGIGFLKKNRSNIMGNVVKIQKVRSLPSYSSLNNAFAMQNYMDYVLMLADNSNSLVAIFADRLVESLNNAEDENAIADLYAFYVPLSERVGQKDIFEGIRNAFFMETNKEGYSVMRSRAEELIASERGYGSFGEILASFEDDVKKMLDVEYEIHTRVKSIYSMYEKITSPRRNADGSEERIDTEKLRTIKLDDIKGNMQDILGLHVVVKKEDMDKAMASIEKTFEDSKDKAFGFTLEKEEKGGFSYDVTKGYSSMRYKFRYKGEIVGELILYTEEEYKNEHYGMLTDTAYKYAMPHWIYKLGTEQKDLIRGHYPDNVFAINVSLRHLFRRNNPPEIVKDKNFYFYSDAIDMTGRFDEDFRLLRKKVAANGKYVVVEFDDGTHEIVRLPPSATGYDLLAAISGQDSYGNYEFPEVEGLGRRALHFQVENLAVFKAKRPLGLGRNPFEKIRPSGAQISLKAKVFAHARGSYGEICGMSDGLPASELAIYGEFAGSIGVSVDELLYAIAKGLVDINEISAYAKIKGMHIFEVKIKTEEKDGKKKAVVPADEILKGDLFNVTKISAEKGYDAYKVIFSGEEGQIEDIIQTVKDAGYEIIMPKGEKSARDSIAKKVAYLPMRALGVNLAGLFGISQSMKDYPAVSASALIALFDSGAFDGTFFDESNLLLRSEANKIIFDLRKSFEREKDFGNFSFELKISDNPALITEDAFALSTLDIDADNGKITLYIHKSFLEAMESLSDEERNFYLTQLVIHEAGEYFDLAGGRAADYEEYHKNIETSDPSQAKLMRFAASAAGYNPAAAVSSEYPHISQSALKTAKSSVTGLPSILLKYLNDLNNNRQEYAAEDLNRNIDAYYEALHEYIERIETSSLPSGLYNEKLPVSAVLKNNTGIGELTALAGYSQGVLKEASVKGFTMFDLFMPSNPMAANYLLIDWSDIEEAKGIVSEEELSAAVEEMDSPDINAVAKRKLRAAQKVYDSLNPEQVKAVGDYYAQNSSWIDALVSAESLKYAVNMDAGVMAMQQMFFERQLKQTLAEISGMNVSMLLKEVTAANAKELILKWSELGIGSFNIDIENISDEILENLRQGIDESGRFASVFIRSANQNAQSAQKISQYGFTPVISFEKLNQFNISNSDFRVEIDDETLINNADIEALLKKTVNSGAKYVDYPVGLLWGDRISSEHMDEYRVPPKGSGLKLGLFKRILQDTVPGAYSKGFETGSNFRVPENANIQISASVWVNGKELPLMFAAALAAGLAGQNNLGALSGADFENIAESFRVSLNLASVMPEASVYIKNGLNRYRNAAGEEEKRIEAARLAGFIQGLNENIIISGAKVKFVSKGVAGIYSRLVIERSLFESGFFPAGHKGVLPVEIINGKINDVLNTMNLKGASGETIMLLNNLSARAGETGFTFDFQGPESLAADGVQSEKAAQTYSAVINVMLDILIDIRVNKEDIKKSLSTVPYKAVISILSAA
jgi:hypothetical protein